MSRLVAVSNRISVPKRGAAVTGGLAVGLLAAMQARRGLWFGWDGETVETASESPSVVLELPSSPASMAFVSPMASVVSVSETASMPSSSPDAGGGIWLHASMVNASVRQGNGIE